MTPKPLHDLDRYHDLARLTERNFEIVREVAEGREHKEIAHKYGVSVPWVSRLAKRFGMARQATTSNKIKKKVVAAIKRGTHWKILADKHGISRTTIYRWVKEAEDKSK